MQINTDFISSISKFTFLFLYLLVLLQPLRPLVYIYVWFWIFLGMTLIFLHYEWCILVSSWQIDFKMLKSFLFSTALCYNEWNILFSCLVRWPLTIPLIFNILNVFLAYNGKPSLHYYNNPNLVILIIYLSFKRNGWIGFI